MTNIKIWNVIDGNIKSVKVNNEILNVKESYNDSESPLIIAERFFDTFEFQGSKIKVSEPEKLALKYSVPVKKLTVKDSKVFTTIEKFDGMPIIKEYLENIRDDIGSENFKRHDIIKILEKCMPEKAKSSIDTYASKYMKYLKINNKLEKLSKGNYKFKLMKADIDYKYLKNMGNDESNIKKGIL